MADKLVCVCARACLCPCFVTKIRLQQLSHKGDRAATERGKGQGAERTRESEVERCICMHRILQYTAVRNSDSAERCVYMVLCLRGSRVAVVFEGFTRCVFACRWRGTLRWRTVAA